MAVNGFAVLTVQQLQRAGIIPALHGVLDLLPGHQHAALKDQGLSVLVIPGLLQLFDSLGIAALVEQGLAALIGDRPAGFLRQGLGVLIPVRPGERLERVREAARFEERLALNVSRGVQGFLRQGLGVLVPVRPGERFGGFRVAARFEERLALGVSRGVPAFLRECPGVLKSRQLLKSGCGGFVIALVHGRFCLGIGDALFRVNNPVGGVLVISQGQEYFPGLFIVLLGQELRPLIVPLEPSLLHQPGDEDRRRGSEKSDHDHDDPRRFGFFAGRSRFVFPCVVFHVLSSLYGPEPVLARAPLFTRLLFRPACCAPGRLLSLF